VNKAPYSVLHNGLPNAIPAAEKDITAHCRLSGCHGAIILVDVKELDKLGCSKR
jgi:hypothetical protein